MLRQEHIALVRAEKYDPFIRVAQEAKKLMEGLFQGLKPETKVTFREAAKAKRKQFPRDLREIRKRVQEHRYHDIVSRVKSPDSRFGLVRCVVEGNNGQRLNTCGVPLQRVFTDDIARVLQFNKNDAMPYIRKKSSSSIQLIFLKVRHSFNCFSFLVCRMTKMRYTVGSIRNKGNCSEHFLFLL